MRSIVTKHRMYPVRHGGCEVPQDVAGLHGERPSRAALRTRTWTFDRCHKQLDLRSLPQVELALLGSHLSQINVEVADRISLRTSPGQACHRRHRATGLCHYVAGGGGARSVSDAGWSPVARTGTHPVAAACGVGTPPQLLPPLS